MHILPARARASRGLQKTELGERPYITNRGLAPRRTEMTTGGGRLCLRFSCLQGMSSRGENWQVCVLLWTPPSHILHLKWTRQEGAGVLVDQDEMAWTRTYTRRSGDVRVRMIIWDVPSSERCSCAKVYELILCTEDAGVVSPCLRLSAR